MSAERPVLREVFDDEMRRRLRPPPGLVREDRGPLTWIVGPTPVPLDHMVCHSRLRAGEAEGVVAAEVARARAGRHGLQWNVYGHDEPPGLVDLLARHGLGVQAREDVLAIRSDDPRLDGEPPAGVEIRGVARVEDLGGVFAVQEAVWDASHTPWLRRWFEAALRGEGDPIAFAVAWAGGAPVAAAYVTLHARRSFAGLYGGTVLPAFRGRGIYRALVAARARAARAAGNPYLVTGANANSGPRLRRLGFSEVATCTEMVLPAP